MNSSIVFSKGAIFPVLILLIWQCTSPPQAVAQADDSLKKVVANLGNINSIVKNYDAHLEITDLDEARYTVRRKVTVLNESGRKQGQLVLPYDQFRKIKNVDITLYTTDGEQIKKLEKENISDLSGTSSYSLYDDNRLKVYTLYHYKYPYDIEIEYKLKYKGLLALPTWSPQNEGEIVNEAQLTVITPATVPVRHRTKNMDKPATEPVKGSENNRYIWNWSSLSTLQYEPYGPPKSEIKPIVYLTPSVFEIGDSRGTFNSWQGFGKWYYELSKNRDQLSEEAKAEIDNLIGGIRSKKEVARILYGYLQDKTRYISIQLGMGGWQPFPAEYVYERGYGDCKALTNYMKTMLNYAGITAYPALIRNGGNPGAIKKDFPINRFNHVILMVKADSDTLWLESTSQKLPFGYIGKNNANRFALLATPEGGQLVKTPKLDVDDNSTNSQYKVSFQPDGTAHITAQHNYNGYPIDKLYFEVASKNSSERETWIRQKLGLSELFIHNADFSDLEKKLKSPSITYSFESNDFSKKFGTRFFIPVNAFNRWNINLPNDNVRKTYFDIGYAFQQSDTTLFKLPDTWKIEASPASDTLATDFAKVEFKFEQHDHHEVKVIRNITFYQDKIEPEQFEGFVELVQNISKLDNKNFVAIRKQ
mgnify:CR=1 FL=1